MAQKLVTIGASLIQLSWDWENQIGSGNFPDKVGFTHIDAQQATGTAATQMDLRYSAQITISASGNTTLALNALVDPVFGGTINLARVKLLIIELPASAANQASSITVGAAASTPFTGYLNSTGTLTINKGEICYQGMDPGATGHVVSTGINLKILNNDGVNTATINLVIAGCSV